MQIRSPSVGPPLQQFFLMRIRTTSVEIWVEAKKETRSKKERKGRPVETAATMEIRKDRGFPQLLGKASQKTLGFTTVTTGPAAAKAKQETEIRKGAGSDPTEFKSWKKIANQNALA